MNFKIILVDIFSLYGFGWLKSPGSATLISILVHDVRFPAAVFQQQQQHRDGDEGEVPPQPHRGEAPRPRRQHGSTVNKLLDDKVSF